MTHTTIPDGGSGLAIRTILNDELAELLGNVKNGLIVVADTTARDALPAEYLKAGTLVYITADDELQEYNGVDAWAQPPIEVASIVTTAMSNLNGGITVTPADDRAAATFRRNSASQTAKILQIQEQDNSPLMSVDKDGKIDAPGQTISGMSNLNGGVTVTPASDIPAATFRRNSDAQTSYILQAQTEANAHLAGIDKAGKVDGKTAAFGDGTNYSEFEADGTLVFHGDATVWNDIFVQAGNLRPGNTPPSFVDFIGGIYEPSFVAGQSDEVHGAFEIPHDYKEGTAIYVHAHCAPSTTNTGNLVIGFEYEALNDLSTATGTTNTPITPLAMSGVAKQIKRIELATIPGAGRKIGDIVPFRFYRQNGGTDTFTGDLFVLSIGLHYQMDSCGSRQITTK